MVAPVLSQDKSLAIEDDIVTHRSGKNVPLLFRILLRPILFISLVFLRFHLAYLSYAVEDKLISPATAIFFTRSTRTRQRIGLKPWRRRRPAEDKPEDLARH